MGTQGLEAGECWRSQKLCRVNTARSDTGQKSQAIQEDVSVILLRGGGWKEHMLWESIYIKCLEEANPKN